VLVAVLNLAQTTSAQARFQMGPTRAVVMAPTGMVATSHPLAVQVGLEILQKGGNAIDAAVATSAALGLMEPQSCGIGGDLFVIYWDNASRKLYGLNASGRSPYGLSIEKLRALGYHETIPEQDPLAWSVPGCVDGWGMLLKRFGSMGLAEVLVPAIRYAEDGFPVNNWAADPESEIAQRAEFRRTYLPRGRELRNGEVFKNPDLARSYRLIAEKGRNAFYEGRIAREIVAYSKRLGGFITMKDLADHTSEWVEPVSTNYRGYDVWELPPNGQGIAVLQMLNILEGFDLKAMGHNSAQCLHLLIEAKKLAFADRARFYADMDFSDVPLEGLISKRYAAERRALIKTGTAALDDPYGSPPGHGETIYLTVTDKERNMVSFIQSVYWVWGSGLVPDDLGFVLQNRGALFALDQEHPNRFEPHKRPFHTIIPAFVTRNGNPWFCFGVMGGAMQPQGQVQVLCNIIDFGMNIQAAGDAPRFRHMGSSQPTGVKMEGGGRVALEFGIDPDVRRELHQKGHTLVSPLGVFFGGYQGIMLDPESGMLHGASDPRRDGCAFGY
jgi:gamma-glutamyltranspeptidase/glutathione hydrolase